MNLQASFPGTLVAQVQWPSTGMQSEKQFPDRTSAQRAVSKKDMVTVYQNSPEYFTMPLMRMTDLLNRL